MFQMIGEKVDVIGLYTKAHFLPKKIKWAGKVLLVEKLTLISEIRDGEVKKRMYSFTNGVNMYRLLFNRDTEVWTLEEVWVE